MRLSPIRKKKVQTKQTNEIAARQESDGVIQTREDSAATRTYTQIKKNIKTMIVE